MDSKVIPNYHEIDAIIRRLAYQYFWNDADHYERALTHPVSWLVAGAPFLAGCDKPARWAATNLGTVMNAKNNPGYFRADSEDDLTSRLRPILQNEGTKKPDVFRKIELLLQLILLQSYEWDKDDDAANDRYNALADPGNSLDFDSTKARLLEEIAGCGEMPAVDEIFTAESVDLGVTKALRGYWY